MSKTHLAINLKDMLVSHIKSSHQLEQREIERGGHCHLKYINKYMQYYRTLDDFITYGYHSEIRTLS